MFLQAYTKLFTLMANSTKATNISFHTVGHDSVVFFSKNGFFKQDPETSQGCVLGGGGVNQLCWLKGH